MKNKNFLLGFLGTQKEIVKGKNPNLTGKLIKSKPVENFKKQKQSEQKQSIASSKKNLSSQQRQSSGIVKQIQKLQKQLQSANQNIGQTQKKLDIDLFLKKQKQKRQQYAKNINQEYQIQKKKRQEMLYKKYNRGDKNQTDTNGQGLQQTKNIRTAMPLEIIKILQNQNKSISKSKTIVNGHHYSLQMLDNDNKMMTYEQIVEEQKQLLFFQETFKQQNSGMSLTSLKKIAQNMLNVNYFPIDFSKPNLQASEQYQNLMNALTLMPEHLSSKYFGFKQINKNMYFMCKLFFNGQRKSVITSDLIQTRQFSHYHINLHSKMSDNRNFGPTIVQKCFRKVSSNLEYPDLALSIFTLYGVDVQIIPISNRNYIKQNFETILKWLLNSGQIVSFINHDNHNSTIYQNRLYKLKQILQTVQLPNKHQHEKKKKKKDKPQTLQIPMNQSLKKHMYHFDNPYKGLLLDTKGLNKFQLLQVLQKFNNLVIIRDYPKGWSCKRINLQLYSLGPLSMTSNEWTKNNQYHFSVTSSTNLRIVMRKLQTSNAESIIKKQIAKQQDFETNNIYGFMVFVCREGQQKISCMKLDSLIVKTKSNDSLEWPSCCCRFQKGSYIIIPYSNKVTKTNYQFFNLDFFIEKSQNVQFGKSIINEWNWIKQSQSSHTQKVIQSLQSKQYVQKTKTQDIQIPKISPNILNSQKLLQTINKTKLTIPKDNQLSDVLIPGKLVSFLINPDVQIKTNKQKTNKKRKQNEKENNKLALNKNDQIQSLQKQQSLQILLGYDILQGEDINRGLMMQEIDNNEEVFDFQHYGLGSDGLTAIMENLMGYPSIRKLNLANNDLDDSAIVFLCYYLDKGNRVELQELNVSHNNFGKIGMDSIKGIMARFQKLNIVY